MKFSLLGSAILVVAFCEGSALAFPTGTFECGKGQTTSIVEIESVTVGTKTLPRLSVTLKRSDLDSELTGIGLTLKISDKKTGEIERRILLPGSNFELKYDERDEPQLLSHSRSCRRKS